MTLSFSDMLISIVVIVDTLLRLTDDESIVVYSL